MQQEQYTPPQSEQPSWYGVESYAPERQLDTDQTSIEVLRARRAAAEALASIPSGVLETIPVTAEKLRQGQLREVGAIGARLTQFRQAYQENNFDLSDNGDDEVRTAMFDQPALKSEDTINLTEVDEIDPDMFTAQEPDMQSSTQDMFDKAA